MRMRSTGAAHRTERPIIVPRMASLRQSRCGGRRGIPSFVLFLVTVVLCLLRARDQPGSTSVAGGRRAARTSALLAARRCSPLSGSAAAPARCPRRALLTAAAAFAALIVVSALANGATAFVAAGKLVELAALTSSAARPDRLDRAALGARCRSSLGVTRRGGGWARRRLRPRTVPAARRRSSASTTSPRSRRWRSSSGSRRCIARAADPDRLPLDRRSSPGASPSRSARRSRACSASTSPPRRCHRARRVRGAAPPARRCSRRCARRRRVTAGTLALRSGELGFLQQWFAPAGPRRASTRRAGASA